ncbi:hypothetical protein MBOE_57000 [Mycolicibacterium boenickei]|uniref:Uncharacterized protein n=1 Tax=Mycolicibacterium boenickei TaxID=146017 RepID=A0ABM7J4A3_9MYCO|nr:hypothetical protein MBOE_57000 [Mycolicibacterium boenickei]
MVDDAYIHALTLTVGGAAVQVDPVTAPRTTDYGFSRVRKGALPNQSEVASALVPELGDLIMTKVAAAPSTGTAPVAVR